MSKSASAKDQQSAYGDGVSVYREPTKHRWCVRLAPRVTGGREMKKRFPDAAYGGDHWASKQAANLWAALQRTTKAAAGTSGFALTPAQTQDAARATERLAGKNLLAFVEQHLALEARLAGKATLAEAVEHLIATRYPRGDKQTLSHAVADYLAHKQAQVERQELSAEYLDRVEHIIKEVGHLGGYVHEVGKQKLEEWLSAKRVLPKRFRLKVTDQLKGPRRNRRGERPAEMPPPRQISNASWNHYRADLATFFGWCIKQGWCAHNPAKELDKRKARRPEIGYLSPEEALALLNAAAGEPGSPMLGMVVLGLFAGLRTEEIARTNWADVLIDDPEDASIYVPGPVSKDQEPREVPLGANAIAWLKIAPFRTGAVAPANWENKLGKLRGDLGRDWPFNAMRHTYATYKARLEGLRSAADDLGHEDTGTTRRHYAASRARKRAARAYFSITPTTTPAQLTVMLTPSQTAQGEQQAAG